MKRKLTIAAFAIGTCFAGLGSCVQDRFCKIPGVHAEPLEPLFGAVCPPIDLVPTP